MVPNFQIWHVIPFGICGLQSRQDLTCLIAKEAFGVKLGVEARRDDPAFIQSKRKLAGKTCPKQIMEFGMTRKGSCRLRQQRREWLVKNSRQGIGNPQALANCGQISRS